jgi:hypothetical protein
MAMSETPELLTERELQRWPDLFRDAKQDSVTGSYYDAIAERLDADGRQLLQTYSDQRDSDIWHAEDVVLFLAGTLCVLNGQRALWTTLYHVFQSPLGEPTEDAFEFVDSMMRQVRRAAVNGH